MTRRLVLCAVFGAILPVWASEPGQPLDCGDWTFDLPGLICEIRQTLPEQWTMESKGYGSGLVVDNEGFPTQLKFRFTATFDNPCWTPGRTSVVRLRPDGTEEAIATIEDRENLGMFDHVRPLTFWDSIVARGDLGGGLGAPVLPLEPLWFDPVSGELTIPVRRYCHNCQDATEQRVLVVIRGLTPLFEIMSSYEPTSNTIGFRVPSHPEQFRAADSFDTYWGNLDTVGDWGRLQPLRCGFPASVPLPGDHLTVEGLPGVGPGEGVYVLTAVNYQGERRYGRKSIGGMLSGRDPAALPECGQ